MATTENEIETVTTNKYWLYMHGNSCGMGFTTEEDVAGYITRNFPLDEYDNFTVVETHVVTTTLWSPQRAISL